MLQIVDMSDAFSQRYMLYTSQHSTDTLWDDPELSAITDGKSEFIFLYTDNDITMPTAYYGYFHDMRQNNYYFARDIDDKVREGIDQYLAELKNKNVRDDAVYVMRLEDYDANRDIIDALDAHMTTKYDHVIFTR